MAAVDDDIRADFLVEAGELVQRLPEQLMQLEQQPEDIALLNAIFRAFHTVKGGAGFLEYTAMVELCHATEDLFNLLRNGKRGVTPELMDVVLKSADHLAQQMREVVEGGAPAAAPAELLQALHALCSDEKPKAKARAKGKEKEKAAQPQLPLAPAAQSSLEKVGDGAGAVSKTSDTISEDEFEALLDQLQAEKKNPPAAEIPQPVPAPLAGEAAAAPSTTRTEARPAAVAASPAPAETTIRVDTHRLDKLMNLVGELVLVRNRLRTLRGHNDAAALAKTVANLDFITRDLQGAVMQIRMQPVKKVFSRFPKVARDLARQLGKQVEVTLVGEDTDLDKNLVEALADPLVHMVRNA
ncbi:MAG TPA: Hpt domain-containing protein, partial [Nevskiaceae bacterium]|nr:Hpt domain-containing protein [Nevskiaceae bacterium]